ncbi:hypothetical protein M0R45_016022 [Rubus argutus]|uniref:Uncharacterized protein n=1 Tax=Rubus argutus TaxID=59490 RepID=A0AAW1XRY0_RUBAR
MAEPKIPAPPYQKPTTCNIPNHQNRELSAIPKQSRDSPLRIFNLQTTRNPNPCLTISEPQIQLNPCPQQPSALPMSPQPTSIQPTSSTRKPSPQQPTQIITAQTHRTNTSNHETRQILQPPINHREPRHQENCVSTTVDNQEPSHHMPSRRSQSARPSSLSSP